MAPIPMKMKKAVSRHRHRLAPKTMRQVLSPAKYMNGFGCTNADSVKALLTRQLAALTVAGVLAACSSATAPASLPSASPSATASESFSINEVISESVGKDTVETLAFSPDGIRIAIGAGDGIVANYALAPAAGEEPILGKLHNGLVSGLAWSPDGKQLLSAAADGTIRQADAASMQVIRSYSGSPNSHPAVAWSPDGQQLAVALGRDNLQLFDAASGNALDSFDVAGATRALLWLATSEIAIGDDTGRISFFTRGQPAAARVFRPAKPHKAVNSLSLSPADGSLAVGYDDGVVVQVDTAAPKTIRDLFNGRQIGTVAWSPNGKVLAVSSVEFDLKLLDAQGSLLTRADVGYDVNATAWSPDGKYVAAAADDHTFKVWQVSPPQKPAKLALTPPSFMGR